MDLSFLIAVFILVSFSTVVAEDFNVRIGEDATILEDYHSTHQIMDKLKISLATARNELVQEKYSSKNLTNQCHLLETKIAEVCSQLGPTKAKLAVENSENLEYLKEIQALQNTSKICNSKVLHLVQQSKTLKEKNDDMAYLLSMTKSDRDSLRKSIGKERIELGIVLAAKEAVEEEGRNLKIALVAANHKVEKLEFRTTAVMAKTEEAQQEVSDLKVKLTTLGATEVAANKEIEKLRFILNETQLAFKDYKLDAENGSADKEEFKNRVIYLGVAVFSALVLVIYALTAKIEELQSHKVAVELQLSELAAALDAVRLIEAAAREEVNMLRVSLAEAQASREAAENTATELAAALSGAQTRVSVAEANEAESKEEADMLRVSLAEAQASKEAAENTITELAAELSLAQTSEAAVKEQVTKLQLKLAALLTDKEATSAVVAELTGALSLVEAEMASALTTVQEGEAAANDQVQNLRQQLADSDKLHQAQHGETQQQLADEKAKHGKTQQELDDEKAKHCETQQHLAKFQAQYLQAQQQLADEKAQHRETQQLLAVSQAQHRAMQQQLAASQAQYLRAQEELERRPSYLQIAVRNGAQTPSQGAPQTPIRGAPQTPNRGVPQTPIRGAPPSPQTPIRGAPQTPSRTTSRRAAETPSQGGPAS